jgi:hypothetical protein
MFNSSDADIGGWGLYLSFHFPLWQDIVLLVEATPAKEGGTFFFVFFAVCS